MVRSAICAAVLIALTAGSCSAAPSRSSVADARAETLETHSYNENETAGSEQLEETVTNAGEDGDGSDRLRRPSLTRWILSVMHGVYRQLTMQQRLVLNLIDDAQTYFDDMVASVGLEGAESSHVTAVRETLNRIRQRMAQTNESMAALEEQSSEVDLDAMRTLVGKYIKEVRVQEVLLDALWASTRGSQTSVWLQGLSEAAAAAAQQQQVRPTAAGGAVVAMERAAKEFLYRMHAHLVAAGIREQDLEKFMPQLPEPTTTTRSSSSNDLPASPRESRRLAKVLRYFGVPQSFTEAYGALYGESGEGDTYLMAEPMIAPMRMMQGHAAPYIRGSNRYHGPPYGPSYGGPQNRGGSYTGSPYGTEYSGSPYGQGGYGYGEPSYRPPYSGSYPSYGRDSGYSGSYYGAGSVY